MDPLTPAQIAFLVNEYQRLQFFHPMTCAVDSGHAVMKATTSEAGDPIWTCPTCGWVQYPDIQFATSIALGTLRLVRNAEARQYYGAHRTDLNDAWAKRTLAKLKKLAAKP